MKVIIGYVRDHFHQVNRLQALLTTMIISVLIAANYYYRLNHFLVSPKSFWIRFVGFFGLFGMVFAGIWLLGFVCARKTCPLTPAFFLLLMASPAVYAIKVSLQISDLINVSDLFLQTVLLWPLKCLATVALSALLWAVLVRSKPFAGLSAKNFDVRPYIVMLLLLCPFLLLFGQRPDFQAVYPKLQLVREHLTFAQKMMFELSYGLDFFTIELFFRGFLILAFIKYGGAGAVLPMAAFYCTIHFGKPVAECISSYFGGLVLGAVVLRTRSIWGGLIVHLGIAWAMEAIGILF